MEEQSTSFLQLLLSYWPFVLVVSLALVLSRTYFNRGLNRYPGPLLANFTDAWRVWDVSLNRHQHTLRDLHDRYGAVSSFYLPFVAASKGKQNPSLFTMQDEHQHAAAKRPVANIYSLSSLTEYEPLVDDMIKLFMDRLEEEFDGPRTKGRACDMAAWLQYYAFDVVLQLTFSNTLGFLAQGADAGGFIKSLEDNMDSVGLMSQMPWLRYLWRQNPLLRVVLKKDPTIFPAFVRQQYAEHRAKLASADEKPDDAPSGERVDMLTRFMRLPGVPVQGVLSYATSNVIAGSDTTAITLRAILYYLLRNPAALRTLRAEMQAADPPLSYPVTWKESQRLPYLRAVVEESLRIFPAVGLPLERVVPSTGLDMPDGYVLPAGTKVGINPWVAHQQPPFGPLPTDQFLPERWLRGPDESQDAFDARLAGMKRAELAFGWGKRICIGRNISYLEIYKVVPTLLREFDLELADPAAEWQTVNRWFVRQKNMDCLLRRRTNRV